VDEYSWGLIEALQVGAAEKHRREQTEQNKELLKMQIDAHNLAAKKMKLDMLRQEWQDKTDYSAMQYRMLQQAPGVGPVSTVSAPGIGAVPAFGAIPNRPVTFPAPPTMMQMQLAKQAQQRQDLDLAVQRAGKIAEAEAPYKRPLPVAGRDIPLPEEVASQRRELNAPQPPALLPPEQEAQRLKIAAAGRSNLYSTTPQDLDDTSQGIIEGKLTPDLGKYSFRDRTALAGRLQRSGFNQTKMLTEWGAVQKYMTSANSATQLRLRQAVEKIGPHTDLIEGLYSQLEKKRLPTGFKIWNSAALAAARNLPGETGALATNLEGQINDLAAELGNVYMGGNTPTDQAMKQARTNLSTEWNPETFHMAVQLIKKNVVLRRNAIRFTGPAGIPTDSPYMPSDLFVAPEPTPTGPSENPYRKKVK